MHSRADSLIGGEHVHCVYTSTSSYMMMAPYCTQMTRKNNKNTLTDKCHRVQYDEGHTVRVEKWQIFLQFKQKGKVTVYITIHSESHDKIQAGHLRLDLVENIL